MIRRFVNIVILSVLLLLTTSAYAQQDGGKLYRVLAVSQHDSSLISTSNTVEVHPQIRLFLPNAFTPNGDGLNDTFGVEVNNLRSMQLRIFDRWGQLVFESNDPNQRWDGMVNGQKGQSGVYAYQISLKGSDGSSLRKDGSVMLIN